MKPGIKALTALFFIFLIVPLTAAQGAQNETNSRIQVTEAVTIEEFNFEGRNLTVIFESDIPEMVALVDQNSFSETGAGKPNVKVTRLAAGRTEVNMALEPGRYDTVFISVGTEGFATLSDRSQPLLHSVYKSDLPIVAVMSVFFGFAQFFGRRYWSRLRLGYGLRRVG